jgi:hypothetical protein
VPIKGTVTFHGTPLTTGSIAFRPGPETDGPAAGAEIVNGTFTIPQSLGPTQGWYLARITIVEPKQGDHNDASTFRLKAGFLVGNVEVPVEIVEERTDYEFKLPMQDETLRRRRR